MPLDEFQKGVIAIISRNRGPRSPFAGGAVIQQHGFRLSVDQDIFAAGDLDELVRRDAASLEAAGYSVRTGRSFDGFRECMVMKPMIGTTTLQWTHGLIREFYAPVPDRQFGYRLHFADLAVNKALAAGSRMKKRDFADLWMLDRHVMPLWRMACAVPGKDPDFSPFALVEEISRNWHFAKLRDDDRLEVTIDITIDEMGPGLRNSLHEARLILRDLGPECYGRLQVDDSGGPVTDRKIKEAGYWKAPRAGGALPAFADMDSEMIAGLIAEYGPEGCHHTGNPSAVAGFSGKDDETGAVDPPKADARNQPEDSDSSPDI